MKLPKMTSQQSVNQIFSLYNGMDNKISEEGISLMVDIGCLAQCVGPTARQCMHCGTNRQCWINCAGAPAISCIDQCFAVAAAIVNG